MEALKQLYGENLSVDDEDEEYVPIEGTAWYQQVASRLTPGKSLRIYRTNAKLTLAALSELSGIPRGHLSQMEHDKRPIGRIIARKLARALHCDYRSLL